jgi:hypothetical protein
LSRLSFCAFSLCASPFPSVVCYRKCSMGSVYLHFAISVHFPTLQNSWRRLWRNMMDSLMPDNLLGTKISPTQTQGNWRKSCCETLCAVRYSCIDISVAKLLRCAVQLY